MPAKQHVRLAVGELFARRSADALLDDVDARRHLGHAVLHLNTRVHLQEEILGLGGRAPIHREQALDRARADVVHGPCGLHADLPDALAHRLIHDPLGGRRLLDELLVAALDRAVALAQVDRGAVLVGEDLDLDVARVGEVALEVDGRVGEELLALACGPLERVLQLGLVHRDAEPLAAAPAGGLDGDRVADLVGGDLARGLEVGDGLGRAGDDRHARLLHQLAGARLGAHRLDRARRRPDEHDPRVLERLGERRVLGQEPVAGVDRLGARFADDLEDALDVEVALGGRRAAEQVGLVGAPDVQRVAIDLGVHGDRRHAELLQRADHADRDLSAVGDEDLREHGGRGVYLRPVRCLPSDSCTNFAFDAVMFRLRATSHVRKGIARRAGVLARRWTTRPGGSMTSELWRLACAVRRVRHDADTPAVRCRQPPLLTTAFPKWVRDRAGGGADAPRR